MDMAILVIPSVSSWYHLFLRRILTMGIFTGHMSRALFIFLSLLDYNTLITWICGSQLWSHICFCANMGQPQIDWQRIVSNWVTNFYDNIVGYIPFENLVGKARFVFFSLENSRFLEIWKWPKSIRTERIFKKIKW